jgi:hypothetical protein
MLREESLETEKITVKKHAGGDDGKRERAGKAPGKPPKDKVHC